MKVLKPSKNKLTQGFSTKHPGYDHDDIPDQNIYASFFGKIIQSKNSETRTWQAFSENDPYKETRNGQLLTEDYGNYGILEGTIDGKAYRQLVAHCKPGTVLSKSTEVKAGQVIAQPGRTGNVKAVGDGDGSHSHTEYRNEQGQKIKVEFVDSSEESEKPEDHIMKDKRQDIIDIYKATTGEYPSDDEINARLQENKNTVEIIEDRLRGDGKARVRWVKEWGIVEENNVDERRLVAEYQELLNFLKAEQLGLLLSDDNETLKARIQKLVDLEKTHKDDCKEVAQEAKETTADEQYIGQINIGGFITRFLLKGKKRG